MRGVKQPAIQLVVLGAGLFALKLVPRAAVGPVLTAGRVTRVPVYAMGSLVAFWCIERVAALLM